MTPGFDKLPMCARKQVHEGPKRSSRGKDCSSVQDNVIGTLADRWAGTPEVGNAELGLKGSRRAGQQDGRSQESRLSSWHEHRYGL